MGLERDSQEKLIFRQKGASVIQLILWALSKVLKYLFLIIHVFEIHRRYSCWFVIKRYNTLSAVLLKRGNLKMVGQLPEFLSQLAKDWQKAYTGSPHQLFSDHSVLQQCWKKETEDYSSSCGHHNVPTTTMHHDLLVTGVHLGLLQSRPSYDRRLQTSQSVSANGETRRMA